MEATAKEMRLHTRELLAAVERGEEVVITWRGERKAKLVGWTGEDEKQRPGRNPAFAIWADREGDVDAEVRSMRQRRPLP